MVNLRLKPIAWDHLQVFRGSILLISCWPWGQPSLLVPSVKCVCKCEVCQVWMTFTCSDKQAPMQCMPVFLLSKIPHWNECALHLNSRLNRFSWLKATICFTSCIHVLINGFINWTADCDWSIITLQQIKINYDGFYNDECHRDVIITHFDETHPGSCHIFAVVRKKANYASKGMWWGRFHFVLFY